jgi:ubiquinone/menaquinone biosynthesis C-methylase UbiE
MGRQEAALSNGESSAHFSPYDDPVKFYDPFYPDSQFEGDFHHVRVLIDKYKISSGKRLLDVACGTGRHLVFFQKEFACVGVDVSPSMLGAASQRLTNVRLSTGDLRTFDLKEDFDVVTCLGGGIAYMETEKDLASALLNFYRHTTVGGLLVIDPWSTKESFHDGEEKMRTWDGNKLAVPRLNGLKVARLNVVHLKNNFSLTDYHYLVAAKGDGVIHFSESHQLRLFKRKTIMDSIGSSGYEPIYVPDGLGPSAELFLGLRRR